MEHGVPTRVPGAVVYPPLNSARVTSVSRHDEAAGAPPGAGERDGSRWNAATARVTLRRHWLFALLFTLGVLLRVMAQVAYQPVILYFDSPRYLHNAYWLNPNGPDPLGYLVALRILLDAFHSLALLATFNHLLGLGVAGLIYAVLLRRGVKPWMAALAAGPVLLDGLQLLIEQMVMSEPLFQFFVVLGIALLLWRPRPNPAFAAGAGVAFAAAGLTRYVGLSLVVVGLLFCLLAAGGRFVPRLVTAAALLAAFALPVIGYATDNYAVNGTFAVPRGRVSTGLYARVAASVNCAQLSLPAYERPLCPPRGVVKPMGGSLIQGYALGKTSPLKTYRPPAGETVHQVTDNFVKRAVLQQPLPVARSVAGSLLRPFVSWRRDHRPGELPVARWQFQGRPRPGDQPSAGPAAARLPALPRVHTGPRPARLRDPRARGGPGGRPGASLGSAARLPALARRRAGLAARGRPLPVLVALPAAHAGHHPAGRRARPVGPHVTKASAGTVGGARAGRSG